jgi:hypothetical protein
MVVAAIIKIIHFLILLFLIVTPFIGDEYFLTLHIVIVPFILGHWLTNQSVCALTELEKAVTGQTCDDATFFGKIVGPVYKFRTHKEENLFVWTAMITLWLVTFVRLHKTGFSHFRGELRRLRAQFSV